MVILVIPPIAILLVVAGLSTTVSVLVAVAQSVWRVRVMLMIDEAVYLYQPTFEC